MDLIVTLLYIKIVSIALYKSSITMIIKTQIKIIFKIRFQVYLVFIKWRCNNIVRILF